MNYPYKCPGCGMVVTGDSVQEIDINIANARRANLMDDRSHYYEMAVKGYADVREWVRKAMQVIDEDESELSLKLILEGRGFLVTWGDRKKEPPEGHVSDIEDAINDDPGLPNPGTDIPV